MGKDTKNSNKKIFSKTAVIAVVAIMVIGISTAALLDYYGTMTGTATVEQSLTIEGQDWDSPFEYEIGCVQGETYKNGPFVIENKAGQIVSIGFETQHLADYNGDGYFTDNASDAVTTRYLAELTLENKDTGTWEPITGDGIIATLVYELNSPEFNYDFEATGLSANTSYSLIYYADRQDRFVNWGGDNPGALITTAVSDGDGNLSIEGSNNLAMNLPHSDDWNREPNPDYCENHNGFDSFDLCSGAKIWLVPSSDYDENTKKVNWANYQSYLYETDMSIYDDTDTDGEGLEVGHGKFNLYIENSFDSLAMPGDYKIITTVVPK